MVFAAGEDVECAFLDKSSIKECIRFVTFNVWGEYFGNPASERDRAQLDMLLDYDADFIALQEVTKGFWDSRLVGGLKERGYVVVGEKDGYCNSHSLTPIFYRQDRFKELERGAYLFHPELDKSKGVVWVAVEKRSSGERMVVFSTHFWWKYDSKSDDFVRLVNARDLLRELSQAASRLGATIVGGGDFNAKENASPIVELFRGGLVSARETSPVTDRRGTCRKYPTRDARGQWRGSSLKESEKSQCIDHIVYRAHGVNPVRFSLDCRQLALDISDHSPVIFDFTLEKGVVGHSGE